MVAINYYTESEEYMEHRFSNKNPGAFQAIAGVQNLFNEAAKIPVYQNGCSPLYDEENPEMNNTGRKFSNEFEETLSMFGEYGFNTSYSPHRNIKDT